MARTSLKGTKSTRPLECDLESAEPTVGKCRGDSKLRGVIGTEENLVGERNCAGDCKPAIETGVTKEVATDTGIKLGEMVLTGSTLFQR
jgi:hypothetical protein